MPTQKFSNLNKMKKRIILMAACDEFLETPYSAIKINQIVERAEISRASFYSYFTDKEDLFECIMKSIWTEFASSIFNALERENGNYYNAFLNIGNQMLATDLRVDYSRLIEKTLSEVEPMELGAKVSKELRTSGEFEKFIRRCYHVMDKTLYPDIDEEIMANVMEMVLKSALGLRLIGHPEEEELKRSLQAQLLILDRGLRWTIH